MSEIFLVNKHDLYYQSSFSVPVLPKGFVPDEDILEGKREGYIPFEVSTEDIDTVDTVNNINYNVSVKHVSKISSDFYILHSQNNNNHMSNCLEVYNTHNE